MVLDLWREMFPFLFLFFIFDLFLFFFIVTDKIDDSLLYSTSGLRPLALNRKGMLSEFWGD